MSLLSSYFIIRLYSNVQSTLISFIVLEVLTFFFIYSNMRTSPRYSPLLSKKLSSRIFYKKLFMLCEIVLFSPDFEVEMCKLGEKV